MSSPLAPPGRLGGPRIFAALGRGDIAVELLDGRQRAINVSLVVGDGRASAPSALHRELFGSAPRDHASGSAAPRRRLAARFGTPLYAYSRQDAARARCRALACAFPAAEAAMKVTPTPVLDLRPPEASASIHPRPGEVRGRLPASATSSTGSMPSDDDLAAVHAEGVALNLDAISCGATASASRRARVAPLNLDRRRPPPPSSSPRA